MKMTVINNVKFIKDIPAGLPFVITTDAKDYIVLWNCASKRKNRKGCYVLYNLTTGKSCSRFFVNRDDVATLADNIYNYFSNEITFDQGKTQGGVDYDVVASEVTLNNPTTPINIADLDELPFTIATQFKNYFVGYDIKEKSFITYNLATGKSCARFAVKIDKLENALTDYFKSVTFAKGSTIKNVKWITAYAEYSQVN